MNSLERNKIYFASDFHLGAPNIQSSREREKRIVSWLNHIQGDAEAIYLLGDIFDFWFEYKTVVPKGHIRLLGKLSELRDQGIPIYFFTGNHDMWMFQYFEEELNIPIYRQSISRNIKGKDFLLGHGDGLGPGDYGYKRLKKVFTNPLCQWLFARLHPNFAIQVASFWSNKSKQQHKASDAFLGANKEWLVQYSNHKLETTFYDYFIFGHRHLPLDITLKNKKSRYINLGEWMNFNSYAVFDGETLQLKFFENDNPPVHIFSCAEP